MKKVKLGEVTINIDNRRKPLNNLQRIEKSLTKKYPYCGANNIIDFIDEYIFDENEEILCIAEDGGSWGKDEECTYVMNEKCWVNNHAHVLKMKTSVDINYIKLNLDYLDLTSYITGSTRGKLTKSSLEKIELKLPDYHTQISISKRISDIQKLITKKKDQIQKYKELVKSRFNEMFGSKKFDKVSISELVDDRIETAKKIFDQHDTIKYIDISSIDNKNYKMTGFQEFMLNQAPSRAQQHIRKGDIVVSTVRPNLKNIAITELDDENLVASSGFCVLRALKCLPEYLFAIICSDRFTNKMTNIVTGANYPAIKSSDIMNYIVPLPPIQLQNEFADFVAQVDKSQLAIQKSLEELETLKKSLMQEYFG